MSDTNHSDTTESEDEGTERRSVSRRQFIGTAAAIAGAGVTTGAASGATTDSPQELVDQMTLSEKVHMCHGHDGDATGYIAPITRLGIPAIRMADGPVGVRVGNSTAFPATIAAASTFDRALSRREGEVMAIECKANDQDSLLAPALNIDRVPVNGRTFEYYSEDPYLSGELAAPMSLGIQSEGIVACAKHYVCNNQETDRMSIDANVSERALREIYFPGFKKTIQEGNVGSVMGAYNRVNGEFSTQNAFLLQDVLKGEWGFQGYEVSDWGATHSTVNAANSGHDVEMPGGTYFGQPLEDAVNNGEVSEATVEDKARRVLWAYDQTGHLEENKQGSPGAQNTTEHQNLARQIAEEGAVLLKNQNDVLPLDAGTVDSVAVIGPNADAAVVGGGGSSDVQPPYSVDPLSAIQDRDVSVTYESGDTQTSLVPSSVLTPPSGSGDGLRGEYYPNQDWSGTPETTRVDSQVDTTDTDVNATTGVGENDFSVRWTGTLTAPESGTYVFDLTSDDGSHLYVDGEEVVNNGGAHAVETEMGAVDLSAGDHSITVEWFEAAGGAQVSLNWATPSDGNGVDRARQAASDADVALVFADGSSSEGYDRDDLVLDGLQNDLIAAAANANPDTVAVLRTGGPVVMPWEADVPGILEMWYPGMEDGNATANVLFGDVNPGGKLPITFGRQFADYPADQENEYPGTNGVADYTEGIFVGYRHFDQNGVDPLFEFGHGESYTNFSYSNLQAPSSANAGDAVTVSVDVTNTGSRQGKEIVQLYVEDVSATVNRPPKELKGFETITLAAGETGTVTMELDREAWEYWDPDTGAWTVEDGQFTLLVGASSRDVRLQSSIDVTGGAGDGDSTAPTAPANLQSSNVTSSSADLSWDGSSDSGGSGLDHYNVYVDGTLDHQVAAGTTSTTVSGLSAGTTYAVSVAAVDGAGNESASASTTVETDPDGGQSPYEGPHALPGRIEAENYDSGGEGTAYHDTSGGNTGGAYRSDDVDLESSTEGNYNVGWIADGEWLEYTVQVEEAGTYQLDVRVASNSGGGSFHVEVDGTDRTGSVGFDATGGWQSWTTVDAGTVDLSAGEHVVRIAAEANDWNVNWFEFSATSGGTVETAINCGGSSFTAGDGTTYEADAYYSGGSAASTADAIDGTTDDALYQTNRWGSITYDVPISDAGATYDVELHFAESYWESDGSRVFDVVVEGTEEVSNLDIHAAVGHDVATTRTVTGVTPTDGSLTIDFPVDTDNALVCGITVTRQ